MKKKLAFGLLLFSLVITSSFRMISGTDPNYELAKKYLQRKQYVQAYKYLLIFKYSNIAKLAKPENSEALTELDQSIIQLETYLSQGAVLIRMSKSRGFTPAELDSAFTIKIDTVKFKDIAVQ